jgi:hypothetical protein
LTEPRLVPLIPLPLFSVPVVFDDVHCSTAPEFVSVSFVVPAEAEIFPPGWILKVIATARATPALAPTATAVAAPVNRALRVSLLRIAIHASP